MNPTPSLLSPFFRKGEREGVSPTFPLDETGGFNVFRSNLSNLISDAHRHMESQASAGKWRAYFTGQGVDVWHHATHLFTFLNDGTVVPINAGYGSTTDRCGVRRITQGAGASIGYRELYGE